MRRGRMDSGGGARGVPGGMPVSVPRDAFLRGVGSVLDIMGVGYGALPYRRVARTPGEAMRSDAEALAGDWEAIGGDMREAMRQAGRETEKFG